MQLDWNILKKFVAQPQDFVITTHMRPDGDALGSALALAEALRSLGKNVRVVLPSSLPPRYLGMDPHRQLIEFEPQHERNLAQTQALIIVDTGAWTQLGKVGDWMRRQAIPKLVIDHHLTQDDLGATRLVDTSVEACGRLIHQGITALGVPITPSIARFIFVAIAMDTGWFHHRNVSADTFSLSAELIRAGARPDQIYQELFDANPLPRQKLAGHVLQSLVTVRLGAICHASITGSDYQRTGAQPLDSEDLVNLTMSVQGVQVGLLFLEQPEGGTKVSLRSRGAVDCSKLAEPFGGGGHAAAAGAIVHEPLPAVRDRVLAAVEAAMDAQK
jgi:phosphoesterase RecJ-like protein